MAKSNDKEKNFKTVRKNKRVIYKGNLIRLSAFFFNRNIAGQKGVA